MNAADQRIEQIKSNIYNRFSDLSQLVHNVNNSQGDPDACIGLLSDHAFAKAMLSWFVSKDLTATRQWFYTASKLDQALYKRTEDKSGPLANTYQLLRPLVSNHPGLIRWFGECQMVYRLKQVEDVRTWDYLAYQAPLAIQGDWERLAQRSATALVYLRKTKSKAKYIADQAFFLALARHDLSGMEAALDQLTQPELVRSRANHESGFTENLIFRPAVIYAKIARYHGHEVTVSSPFVPAEWLPMKPLPQYEDIYPFLVAVNHFPSSMT